MKRNILIITFCLAALACVAVVLGSRAPAPVNVDVRGLEGGFSGRVVDGITGESLSAAVSVEGTGGANITVRCDEHGFFEFGLGDGDYVIRPSMEGYVLRGRQDRGRGVFVREATQFVNARLSLWPEAVVRGRVVAGNRGIPAHIVMSYQTDASGAQDYVFTEMDTDEDGAFAIRGAYAGVAGIDVAAGGFAGLELRDIILRFGESTDIGEIPMREGFSVFGTIVDGSSGRGLGGVHVRLFDSERTVIAETKSSGTGTYRLPAVDRRHVWIAADADGYRGYAAAMQLEGSTDRRQDVALKRAWGLDVSVENQTGRAPAMSQVLVTDIASGDVVYDELLGNGRYSLSEFRGGPYLVSAVSPDGLTKYDVRAMAGDSVRLILRPFATVSVRVVRSDGSPVSSGTYSYVYVDRDGNSSRGGWLPFEGESFEIHDLMPGRYVVMAKTAEDGRQAESPAFALDMGDTRDLQIRLTEGGVIRGHVVSSLSHRGVASTVEAEYETSPGNLKKKGFDTDEDGNFVVDDLPVTPVKLTITPKLSGETSSVYTDLVVGESGVLERHFEVVVKGRRGGRPGNGAKSPEGWRPPWAQGDGSEGAENWRPPEGWRPPWAQGDGSEGTENWRPPEGGHPPDDTGAGRPPVSMRGHAGRQKE